MYIVTGVEWCRVELTSLMLIVFFSNNRNLLKKKNESDQMTMMIQNTNTKWNFVNGETKKNIVQSQNCLGPCLEIRTNIVRTLT